MSERMRALVVGGGGREHALAWKLAQSARVASVLVAPGNAGTAAEPGVENAPIAAHDIPGLTALAAERGIDLTVVGPEAALVAGIADAFSARGLRCFAPSRQAAQLEGSKAFAKSFMQRHGIPTAEHCCFEDLGEAEAYVRAAPLPLVVKADGLAAGKGVTVASTREEALEAVRQCLAAHRFGEAGDRVVIERCLAGEEVSFICMVAGERILPLASSQDHKRRDDGDKGPNTGGMGAYSPAPLVDEALHTRIMSQVIEPTVRGLAEEGMDYLGFLYAGLMISDEGAPGVLEFNCRLGDPETQPVLMRLESDLAGLCEAALEGTLAEHEARWLPQASLGIVMAAGGYPLEYEKGIPIEGLESVEDGAVKVFHAGTRRAENGGVVTDGGRVLCVTALGDDVAAARDRAYAAAASINWRDACYRRDIGARAASDRRSMPRS